MFDFGGNERRGAGPRGERPNAGNQGREPFPRPVGGRVTSLGAGIHPDSGFGRVAELVAHSNGGGTTTSQAPDRALGVAQAAGTGGDAVQPRAGWQSAVWLRLGVGAPRWPCPNARPPSGHPTTASGMRGPSDCSDPLPSSAIASEGSGKRWGQRQHAQDPSLKTS
jgi:hypothetical protein